MPEPASRTDATPIPRGARARRRRQDLRATRAADREAQHAAVAARIAPAIFGGEGDRTYLLVVQNNAESRATGGFIGSYGLITAQDGKLHRRRPPPDQDVGRHDRAAGAGHISGPGRLPRRYAQFRPQTTLQNVNLSPDFPSVAQVLTSLAPQAGLPRSTASSRSTRPGLPRPPAHRTGHRARLADGDRRRERGPRDVARRVRRSSRRPPSAPTSSATSPRPPSTRRRRAPSASPRRSPRCSAAPPTPVISSWVSPGRRGSARRPARHLRQDRPGAVRRDRGHIVELRRQQDRLLPEPRGRLPGEPPAQPKPRPAADVSATCRWCSTTPPRPRGSRRS